MNEQFNEGKLVETEFKESMSKFGYTFDASMKEDCTEHWDVICNIDGKPSKVDVKGMKKRNRSDINKDPSIHWIETRNGNNKYAKSEKDRLGWLYGKADYFAFQTDLYFIIVKKEDLISFIDRKCLDKQRYPKLGEPEFYKRYSRMYRDDEMIMIKTDDLMHIYCMLIKRYETKFDTIDELMSKLLKKRKENNNL